VEETLEETTHQDYRKLVESVQIINVVLSEAEIKRIWPSPDIPPKAIVNVKVDKELRSWTKTEFSSAVTCEIGVIYSPDVEQRGETNAATADGDRPVLECNCTFLAFYKIEKPKVKVTEELLDLFNSRNLMINVWPYVREFVSSISTRMGFPAIVLGVTRG